MNKKDYNKMLKNMQKVADNPFIKIDERMAYTGAYMLFRFCKTSPTCANDSITCPFKELIGCNSKTCNAPHSWGQT